VVLVQEEFGFMWLAGLVNHFSKAFKINKVHISSPDTIFQSRLGFDSFIVELEDSYIGSSAPEQ
jgi:hypothetical protein